MLIIFDLDDTLLETSDILIPNNLSYALKEMQKAGLETNDQDFNQLHEHLLQINKTTKNGKQTIIKFLNKINQNNNPQISTIGINAYYKNPNCEIKIKQETLSILKELKNNNINLAIVSHGDEVIQTKKIDQNNLKPLFNQIIITNTYNKLNQYKYLMNLQEYYNQEIIVVGDKFETDLLPAAQLNLTTIHMQKGRGIKDFIGKSQSDYCIKHINELLPIIEKCKQ
jgi:FMN phosphatase YigB (HAD superfamily)